MSEPCDFMLCNIVEPRLIQGHDVVPVSSEGIFNIEPLLSSDHETGYVAPIKDNAR
jgi:hypothetical protein